MTCISQPKTKPAATMDELEEILERYAMAVADEVRDRVASLAGLAATSPELAAHIAELRRLREMLDKALADREAVEPEAARSRATWNLRHLSHQVEKFLAGLDPA